MNNTIIEDLVDIAIKQEKLEKTPQIKDLEKSARYVVENFDNLQDVLWYIINNVEKIEKIVCLYSLVVDAFEGKELPQEIANVLKVNETKEGEIRNDK